VLVGRPSSAIVRGVATDRDIVCARLEDLAQSPKVVLEQGCIVADGAPEEALADALVSRVWKLPARWLGEPGARGLALGSNG